jgi:hypothetical protein
MTFSEALYNCLLRRMELVAFDMTNETHDYWTYSSYYGRALNIGKLKLNALAQFLLTLRFENNLEILYYWTAGAAKVVTEPSFSKVKSTGKISWCSTNITVPTKNTIKLRKKRKQSCLAYSRWTHAYQEINCNRKLSFICEVNNKVVSLFLFTLTQIYSTHAKQLYVRHDSSARKMWVYLILSCFCADRN